MIILFYIWIVGVLVLSIIGGISAYIGTVKYQLKGFDIKHEDVTLIAFWFIVVIIAAVKYLIIALKHIDAKE